MIIFPGFSLITLSTPTIPAERETPASLVGAMRVGGIILVFAFLSIITSYLIIQKFWLEPFIDKYDRLDVFISSIEDLRVRGAFERLARATHDSDAPAVDSAFEASEVAVRNMKEAASKADATHGRGYNEYQAQAQTLIAEVYNWRDAARDNNGDAAAVELFNSIERYRNSIKLRQIEYNARLESYIKIRTAILLIVGAAGGVATWLATLVAIRRTRRSLRRIAEHVSALERGELGPRAMESFVEIAEVNHRLNHLGMALLRSRDDVKREKETALARQSELEIAHELVLDLSRARSEADVVRAFYKYAPGSLRADYIEILRFVNPPGILEELSPAGEDSNKKNRIIEDPNLCLAFRTMETAAGNAPRSQCPATPRAGAATLCVPMKTAYGQIGVVHICAKPGELIDTIPRTVAETFVRLFAPALENARLLRESIERGFTDPLTGLANRRRLDEFAIKAVALAQRQSTTLSVVALDLDKFKNINDDYGHEVGDRALVNVAQAMQSAIRESDIAARLGGDEFILVLPGTTGAMAVRVIERIRSLLSRPMGKHLPVALHLSAGISELSPRAKTFPELLALADRALYDAKRLSRGIGHARPEEDGEEDETVQL